MPECHVVARAREIQNEIAIEHAAHQRARVEWVASKSGDNARALSLADEVLPIFQEIGDHRLYGAALSALARASLALGDAPRARSLLESEVLPIMRQTGDPWNTAALCMLSSVMREQGDYARSQELAAESLDLRRAIQDRHGVADSLDSLALALCRRDGPRTRALFAESLSLRRAIGDRAGIARSERALEALDSEAVES